MCGPNDNDVDILEEIQIMQRCFIGTLKRVTELHGEETLSGEFLEGFQWHLDRMAHFITDEDVSDDNQLSYKHLDKLNKLFWECVIDKVVENLNKK